MMKISEWLALRKVKQDAFGKMVELNQSSIARIISSSRDVYVSELPDGSIKLIETKQIGKTYFPQKSKEAE